MLIVNLTINLGINSSETLNNSFSSDSEEKVQINSHKKYNNSFKSENKGKDSDTNTDSDLEEIKKTSEEGKIYEGDFLNSIFKLQQFMDNQNKQIHALREKENGTNGTIKHGNKELKVKM